MDQHNAFNALEELIRSETALIGDLRDPLEISRQLSVKAIEFSKTLKKSRNQSGNSRVYELFLLSACLASKYRIPLSDIIPAREARQGVSGPSSNDLSKALLAIARETDDIVRAYEGRILPPPDKDGVTLAACLVDVVEKAFSVVDLKDADLYDVVSDLLREKRDRAISSEYLYHPSDAPTLRSFEVIQRKTVCPYARTARLWGAPPWDRDKSIDRNIREIAIPLSKFVYLQRWETLDGFVIGISDDRLVCDMKNLSATLKTILKLLNSSDKLKPNLFDREVRSSEWNFEFLGTRLFVTVFSPLYGRDSPRETYGENSTFIMFQPFQSFLHNKAIRESEKKETRDVLVKKFLHRFANIRKEFSDAGKPYDCSIMNETFQAPRFIKPLRLGDPEIEWWKD